MTIKCNTSTILLVGVSMETNATDMLERPYGICAFRVSLRWYSFSFEILFRRCRPLSARGLLFNPDMIYGFLFQIPRLRVCVCKSNANYHNYYCHRQEYDHNILVVLSICTMFSVCTRFILQFVSVTSSFVFFSFPFGFL